VGMKSFAVTTGRVSVGGTVSDAVTDAALTLSGNRIAASTATAVTRIDLTSAEIETVTRWPLLPLAKGDLVTRSVYHRDLGISAQLSLC
jgi:hypothetical protein